MKIIYLTTALDEIDFVAFASQWTISLSPSNQNFHFKMISALSIKNEVEVISIRPFSKKNCSLYRLEKEVNAIGNIRWNYLTIPHHRILKRSILRRETLTIMKNLNLKNTIVLTDTINPTVSYLARVIKKQFKVPVIGICKESPSNIRNTDKAYAIYIFKNASNFDGYISLTSGLNSIFNKSNNPSLIFEGIVEDKLPSKIKNEFGDYIFYGGSLSERFGIYELFKAFNQIERDDIKLLVCGYHKEKPRFNDEIDKDKRIVNLGVLPYKKVLQLEQNALMNINPRPFNEDLVRFSIPSKTLEHLSTGTITVAVRNTKLETIFKDELIWSKSGNASDLYDSMMKVINMNPEQRRTIGQKGQKKVLEFYSRTNISSILQSFLQQFIKGN